MSPRRPLAAVAFGALLAVTLATSVAHADPPITGTNCCGFDLHLFRPAVDSKGQFTVNGTDILGAGDVSFGLNLDFAFNLLRVGGANHNSALVSNMFTGGAVFNVGIANLLVIGGQIPFQVVSGPGSSDTNTFPPMGGGVLGYAPSSQGLSFQGVGDITLHAKLRILRAEYFPIGLAIILQGGWGPMNGPMSFAGEPNGFLAPSVAAEWRPIRNVRMDFNLGARVPLGTFGTGSFVNGCTGNGMMAMTTLGLSSIGAAGTNCSGLVQYGPSLTWGVGFSWRPTPVLDLVAETYGAMYMTSSALSNEPAGIPWEWAVGAKIFVQRNSYLYVGGGSRILDAYAAADLRLFAGIIFEPSIGDADGDGYRDDVDQCPNDPEDFDGFQDEDGCSDPDNDRDGIPDVNDQCPNVPEDREGIQDTDGCPEHQESDRDGDGILDAVDQCPDDPEDRDGFQDTDGCPDPDNDNDGIPDTIDNCPNDPEDIDGFQDDDGCPDPDNDQDRIPDVRDRCPNEPETYNGVDDEDGCPDSGDLQILGTVISLRQQIQFETDSAEIRAVSSPIIEQMAELLRRNPQFELVEVEGHTDERASDEHNIRLSTDRANSVMQALIQRGIDPHRLAAAGYGELCPLDPGHNARAWERNRRVQFLIARTHDEGRTTGVAGCRRGAQYIPASVGPAGTGVARTASHSGLGGASGSPSPGSSSAPPPSGASSAPSSTPPASH